MLKYLLQAGIIALSTHLISGDQLDQRCIIHIALLATLVFLLIDKFIPKLTSEGFSTTPRYSQPSYNRIVLNLDNDRCCRRIY